MWHRGGTHCHEGDFYDLFDVEDRIDFALAYTGNLAEFGYAVLVNVHREERLGNDDQLLALIDIQAAVCFVADRAIQITLLGVSDHIGVIPST